MEDQQRPSHEIDTLFEKMRLGTATAFDSAVKAAKRHHTDLAISKDGHVVWLNPDTLEISEEFSVSTTQKRS